MPELDIPGDADTDEARTLVRDFVDVGDDVELYDTVMITGEQNRLTGTIVGLEDEYLEMEADSDSVSRDRIQYGDIDRMSLVSPDEAG